MFGLIYWVLISDGFLIFDSLPYGSFTHEKNSRICITIKSHVCSIFEKNDLHHALRIS